jgi:hypothetical protein
MEDLCFVLCFLLLLLLLLYSGLDGAVALIPEGTGFICASVASAEGSLSGDNSPTTACGVICGEEQQPQWLPTHNASIFT